MCVGVGVLSLNRINVNQKLDTKSTHKMMRPWWWREREREYRTVMQFNWTQHDEKKVLKKEKNETTKKRYFLYKRIANLSQTKIMWTVFFHNKREMKREENFCMKHKKWHNSNANDERNARRDIWKNNKIIKKI